MKIVDEVDPVVCERDNGQIQISSEDIEEFMKQMVNDPVLELPLVNGYHQLGSALQVGCPECCTPIFCSHSHVNFPW